MLETNENDDLIQMFDMACGGMGGCLPPCALPGSNSSPKHEKKLPAGGGQGSSCLICLFSEIADCCDKNENLVPLMASTILSLQHCLASALR